MIFINNKYTAIYYKIVRRAAVRILPKELYKERHHIIPKSLGGNNTGENLVSLTGREHLICHIMYSLSNRGKPRHLQKMARG